MEVFATLRYMRERFGISQEAYAKLIGCGPSNYANKERGRVPWSLSECKRIQIDVNERLSKIGEASITIDKLFYADFVSIKKRRKKASIKAS